MISLRHVSRSYQMKNGKYHKVLDDISIDFVKGKNVGILGLNGAGKSTLIRMISGAERPDSGEIIRTSRVSWPIGFAGCFHGSLSGRDNLKFVCRIYGSDIKRVTEYVEDFSELGEYMDMPFSTYSSGMRSKLAFGLSLAIKFDYYLVDEAFSVGDVTFVQKATKELEKLKQRANLIFVSHSINAVKKHCNAGAVLHNGRLTYFDNLNEAIKLYTDICNERIKR